MGNSNTMDIKKYFDKLNISLEEAIDYKNKFIPKILYKYVSLLDDRYVAYYKKNKKRLNSLRDNMLWLSNYKKFNDLFELKMLTIDRERLKGTGWNSEEIEKYLEYFRNATLISCFSSDIDNNMPMWAHYANNHKGYCVKYSVLNPQLIFPVMYEPVRSKSAVIVANIIKEIMEAYINKLEKPSEGFYKYFGFLYSSFTCKHNMWKDEKEYRLLYINSNLNNQEGKLINLTEVGLKVDAIYIGYNCDEIYKTQLIEIAKSIGCDLLKMTFDEYSEEFKLVPELLYNNID